MAEYINDVELGNMSEADLDAELDQEMNTPDPITSDERDMNIASDAAAAKFKNMKRSFIVKVAVGSVIGVGVGTVGLVQIIKAAKKRKAKKSTKPADVYDSESEDSTSTDVEFEHPEKGEVSAKSEAIKQTAEKLGRTEEEIRKIFDAGWNASVKFSNETAAADINELAKAAEAAKKPLAKELDALQKTLASETDRANAQASRANQAEARVEELKKALKAANEKAAAAEEKLQASSAESEDEDEEDKTPPVELPTGKKKKNK